jgi:hypothetical protein
MYVCVYVCVCVDVPIHAHCTFSLCVCVSPMIQNTSANMQYPQTLDVQRQWNIILVANYAKT